MKRNNMPWQAVQPAAVDWTETGDPLSMDFEDIYYSRDNGLQESRHVFLAGNDLPARWSNHPGQSFCIGETGFGTGLNFLMTWQAWEDLAGPKPDLHYLSIEKSPLTRGDMTRALAAWPELAPLADDLLAAWPGLVPGQHRLLLANGRVRLDLWWEEAELTLEDLACSGPVVDAWYLDGFAPARNETMWQQTLFAHAAAMSHPGATFATFTAAGHVRRGLTDAGFKVSRVPGYGRKRESLSGQLTTATSRADTADTPWDLACQRIPAPATAIVLGAGLAGCTAAAALAQRGVLVTLIDQGQLADGASGNKQGILYTRLSPRHSTLTDFALQSFRFSSEFYRQFFQQGMLEHKVDGELCGSFHQSSDSAEMDLLADILAPVNELAQVLEPEAANLLLGIEQQSRGYWYPRSGWIHPSAVCRVLALTSGVKLLENCGTVDLKLQQNQWQASSDSGVLATADCAVIATGTDAGKQKELDWLPLQAIRGQTSQLPSDESLGNLRAALCHGGYISPARNEEHCIGATFGLNDPDLTLREEDHRDNLSKLAKALPALGPALETVLCNKLQGRVGYRCASPDYLPMVGAVPNRQAFLDSYGGLRKNARQIIPQRGVFVPGLYLSTAHGSRGLTSIPMAAEVLASLICNEPAPLSRELTRALSPARFLMRDLARNRI